MLFIAGLLFPMTPMGFALVKWSLFVLFVGVVVFWKVALSFYDSGYKMGFVEKRWNDRFQVFSLLVLFLFVMPCAYGLKVVMDCLGRGLAGLVLWFGVSFLGGVCFWKVIRNIGNQKGIVWHIAMVLLVLFSWMFFVVMAEGLV